MIQIKVQAEKSGPRQVSFRYDLKADKDVPVTMVIGSFSVLNPAAKGSLVLSQEDGGQSRYALPLGRAATTPPVAKGLLEIVDSGEISLAFQPPCPISFDGDMRIMLAAEVFKRGSKSVTLTLTFPSEVAFLASPEALHRLTRDPVRSRLVRLPAVRQGSAQCHRHGRLAGEAGGQAWRGTTWRATTSSSTTARP